jgi:hypothetical protein
MAEIGEVAQRVRDSATVPDLLGAGFEAFEAIRLAARACEDRAPELFAAFMMAAGAAVEGRNALYAAPSLPAAPGGPPTAPTVSPAAGVAPIADELARLAALLTQRLHGALSEATLPGDRTACHHGAQAAAEIHWLLASDHDETIPR